jgi:hypothetical protein
MGALRRYHVSQDGLIGQEPKIRRDYSIPLLTADY